VADASLVALTARRIITQREAEGLGGGHALELARSLGVPLAVTVAAIAQLTGQAVAEVAAAASPPAAETHDEQATTRLPAWASSPEARAPSVGHSQLDAIVARSGGPYARVVARLIEASLGSRAVDELSAWERDQLAPGFAPEQIEQALALLAAVHAHPGAAKAWEEWGARLEARYGDRSAPLRPAPAETRPRALGEREMGAQKRRLLELRQLPIPGAMGLRQPIVRDRHATPGMIYDDLLGEIRCSFVPTPRYFRWSVVALPALFWASDHEDNPEHDGPTRTVWTSYNNFALAAWGRDCQQEEYDAIDAFLCDQVTGELRAEHPDDRKSLVGTPLDGAWIRLEDGQVWPIERWSATHADERPGRRRGPGPTLLLTFSRRFAHDMRTASRRFLLDLRTAWALRDELVTYVRLECHSGIRRGGAKRGTKAAKGWETYAGSPFLRTLGFHGDGSPRLDAAYRRAAELLVEDDLRAVAEAWQGIDVEKASGGVVPGDARNGCAWFYVHMDRTTYGRRPELRTRRTRTRAERRTAWEHEHPERIGRRRRIERPETQAARRRRGERTVSARFARLATAASRRKQNHRHRQLVEGDIAAAVRAREDASAPASLPFTTAA